MIYPVIILPQAHEEIDAALLWLVQRTENAWSWYDRVLKALNSLQEYPSRCPLAPEDADAAEEVRHLIVGDHTHGYRIIFAIRGEAVVILDFQHGARDGI